MWSPLCANVAAEYRVNPLAVLKGYQQLVDEGLVEPSEAAGCSSIPAHAICCCRAPLSGTDLIRFTGKRGALG